MIDTSTFTHYCRAGEDEVLQQLAPGLIVMPDEVRIEVERGRERYGSIASPTSASWVELAVVRDEEIMTQLQVKAALGGGEDEHLGECAVIAIALHRGHVAILDERAAIAQAELRGVATHDSLWIAIEAHKKLFDRDAGRTAALVDALLATGMYLPIDSGSSLVAWAYEAGWMPE